MTLKWAKTLSDSFKSLCLSWSLTKVFYNSVSCRKLVMQTVSNDRVLRDAMDFDLVKEDIFAFIIKLIPVFPITFLYKSFLCAIL